VIPIKTSLLYVQPLYLRAAGGKIPEMKRVVVAYQGDVTMAETLDAALAEVFGGSAATRATPAAAVAAGTSARPDAALQALIAEARQHYDNAMAAQRAGDWARYGSEIKLLGALLERIGARRP